MATPDAQNGAAQRRPFVDPFDVPASPQTFVDPFETAAHAPAFVDPFDPPPAADNRPTLTTRAEGFLRDVGNRLGGNMVDPTDIRQAPMGTYETRPIDRDGAAPTPYATLNPYGENEPLPRAARAAGQIVGTPVTATAHGVASVGGLAFSGITGTSPQEGMDLFNRVFVDPFDPLPPSEDVDWVMDKVAQAGDVVGSKVLEKTGSPTLAAGANALTQVVPPALLGEGARYAPKALRRATGAPELPAPPRPAAQPAPPTEALRSRPEPPQAPNLLRSDLPPPDLTPDERAVAANATGVHPHDVPAADVAAVVAHAERDPQFAQQLVNSNESDLALIAAARAAANRDAVQSGGTLQPDQPAEPARLPPGGDGERGLGAPAGAEESQPAGAGEPARRENPPLIDEPRRVEDASASAGQQPETPARAEARPPMPAPRAKAERPWIDDSFDVPLGGGRDIPTHPDGNLKSPTERTTFIDRGIPEWVWEPKAGKWVNTYLEIDDHEQGEEPHLDRLGYGHKGDAHDTGGNPATESYLARQGVKPDDYAAALKPYLDAARTKAERGEASIPPTLDRRVYARPEFAKLLDNSADTRAPAAAAAADSGAAPEPSSADDLSRVLSRIHQRPVKVEQVAPPNDAARALSASVRRIFGRDVKFVRSDDSTMRGAYVGGKTLFVNVDANRPHAQIIGHELVHSIRREAPATYYGLVDSLRNTINRDRGAGFKTYLADLYKAQGLPRLGPEGLHEELIAEIVGDHFADPGFVRELQRTMEPNLFRRVAAHASDFLDRIRAKVSGTPRTMGRQAARFVDDIDAAKAAIKQALSEVGNNARAGSEPEPAFSRAGAEDLEAMPRDAAGRRTLVEVQSPLIARAMDIGDKALMRAIGRGAIQHAYAVLSRVSASAERALNRTRAMFDTMLSTDEGRRAINDAVHQWETGHEVSDPQLAPFFRSMKAAFDQRVRAVIASGLQMGYLDHYYPHLFRDTEKVQQWMREYLGHRTLEGGKPWLKERFYETMAAAREAGLEPLSENPADMMQAHLRQMDKFIALHQIVTDLQKRGLVIDDPQTFRGPPGYAKVNDPAFRGRLVPEVIARDLNNILGPSLYDQGWWRSFRKAENAMVSANLGFSAFHATMTTLDTIAAHLGDSVQRAFIGDLGGALRSAGKSMTSPIRSPFDGTRLIREALGERQSDVQTAALLRMLEQGGHQVFMSPTELNDTFVKLQRAMRQGNWLKAGKEAPWALLENITPLIHKHLVPAQKMTAKVLALKFELDRLARRVGAQRGDYAAIERGLTEDAVRQIAGRVVRQVDERLGQMNYRNLFWNRTLRDVFQALFTSFGWQIGTLKTIGGGFADVTNLVKPQKILGDLDKAGSIQDANFSRLSSRTAYLVGLHGLLLALNAGLTYALTGSGPQSVADFYTIRTGRKNPDGSDERLILPSYVKDELELLKQPIEMAANKLNPVLRDSWELVKNRDYYGNEIYNPDDDIVTQAKQVGAFLAKSFLPFSVEGIARARHAGKSSAMIAANLAGMNPAPAYMTRSPFATFLADKRELHGAARTPEQAEAGNTFYDAMSAMRRGERPDISGFPVPLQRRLLEESRIAPQEVAFKRLGLMDKLRGWDAATDEERAKYRLQAHIFTSRINDSLADLPSDQQASAIARLRKIQKWKPAAAAAATANEPFSGASR